jgi:hypothetical protein
MNPTMTTPPSEVPWTYLPSDETVLLTIHGILLLIVFVALVRNTTIRYRVRHGDLNPTVTRGDRSMSILTGVFASTVGLYVLAVDMSAVAVGHKAFLVVTDFALLIYLFLYNNWFRNLVIGHSSARTTEAN